MSRLRVRTAVELNWAVDHVLAATIHLLFSPFRVRTSHTVVSESSHITEWGRGRGFSKLNMEMVGDAVVGGGLFRVLEFPAAIWTVAA